MRTSERAGPAQPHDLPATSSPEDRSKGSSAKITERLLNVATAPRKDSTTWPQLPPMTWSAFIVWLDLENPANHKECGGYVGGLLRGKKRDRAHVEHRDVLALDADKASPLFPADVSRTLPGVAAVVHTTWRHHVQGWRYRLLAPLSRPVTADEYYRLACAVRDALGEYWSVDDKGCPEPERFVYRPSSQNDSYAFHVADGGLLDVDAWLGEPEQVQPGATEPEQAEPVELDRYTRKAVDAELARLDECDLLGWSGPGWDTTTFEVACNLIEFANAGWCKYTTDAAHDDLLDRAPTDDGFGPAEHEKCWASALQKVGSKARPKPHPAASDDFSVSRRDVSNTAKAADWLRQEVGKQGTPLAGLFRRGGGLVHTPRIDEDGYVPLHENDPDSEDGPAQVRPVDAARLRSWVQFKYPVQKWVESRQVWVDTTFPADAASLVVNAVELAPSLLPLVGVTHTPMLRADGSVLDAEGYDLASARLYLPERGMTVQAVPDAPTAVEVRAARGLLDEMIADFTFNSDHDRAHYLALLFTPLLRQVVPPPYPLGLIHAHQPGSGKGLLARILRTLHGGALRPLPESQSEMRKQITSILSVTTAPVVQFDNVQKLSSTQLDALLTTDVWSDRPLGSTSDFTGRNDRLWIATGNNVALGGDLARRVRWVSIDPNVPRPELRTDFAIKDLPGWVRDRRGELLSALLTVLRAWVVQGRPLGPEVSSDDYARWTRVVQGVLEVAGWSGTIGHADTQQQTGSDEDAEWAAFLAEAWRLFGDGTWTARELVDHLDLDADELPLDMPGHSARGVGTWLRNRHGRWAGGYSIRSVGKRDGTAVWQVQKVG